MFYWVSEGNNVTIQYFYFPPHFHHWIDLFFLQIQSMSLSLTFSSLADQIICFDVLEEQLFFGCKLCEDLLRLDCVLSAQWSWIFSSDFKKFYFSKEKNICICECVWMQSTWVRFICTWSAEARKGCWVISPITLCIFFFEARALSKSRDGVLSAILKPKFPAFLLSLNPKALYYTCM